MGHGHGHGHGPSAARAGERHRGRLTVAFVLAALFLVVEVVVALATDSLALLSDAGHMLTDTAGLGMALAAIAAASRAQVGASAGRTFGLYRLEVLAALANAVLLFGVAAYVLWKAIDRLQDPVDIEALPVFAVACAGLAVNLVGFWLLREGAKESLNVRGAYLEVLADAVGSAGVIVAAILIGVTGEDWIDPALAIVLGLWILPRTYRLGAQALRVLLEVAPPHIDLTALQADLAAVPGVVDVHDLHVWTLTSEMEVATAHLVVEVGADTHAVLDQARHLLSSTHKLDHATLQVEPADHTGCEQVGW
ncbi:cation diffusion facilitator family transporter [Sporichthya sp.]|uniref:cation diffusion facilitator family transporter n=1 Tax=Sporichthya sp. TaxID=65475 RepID=UPI0017F9DC11|nr:cation diffusion facilitator family transporter [Sporichthya sp.]MBA3743399.1 cation transporter [Sporichthya sp.]